MQKSKDNINSRLTGYPGSSVSLIALINKLRAYKDKKPFATETTYL